MGPSTTANIIVIRGVEELTAASTGFTALPLKAPKSMLSRLPTILRGYIMPKHMTRATMNWPNVMECFSRSRAGTFFITARQTGSPNTYIGIMESAQTYHVFSVISGAYALRSSAAAIWMTVDTTSMAKNANATRDIFFFSSAGNSLSNPVSPFPARISRGHIQYNVPCFFRQGRERTNFSTLCV